MVHQAQKYTTRAIHIFQPRELKFGAYIWLKAFGRVAKCIPSAIVGSGTSGPCGWWIYGGYDTSRGVAVMHNQCAHIASRLHLIWERYTIYMV